MMDIPLDEVVYFDAISSSSTGAAADADSTPTFAVYEEATDTDIGVGGNMTKRTSLTGNYRGSFTASAANGFEVGKWYSVIGSATIGGVATKGVLKSFRIVLAEAVAGAPKTDVTYILGTLLTETSGQIAAAFKKFFNVSTPTGTVNSLPDAVPGAASGLLIAGTNAPVTITGSGNALRLISTGSNGNGLYAEGNGSGDGVHSQGGMTGRGIHALGGGTSGSGFRAQAQTQGDGFEMVGAGTGKDLNATSTALTLAKTTNITGFNDLSAAQVNSEADTALADAKAGYAVAIEAAILDEGDATALLAAIAAKVEEFLINEGDATATIAAIATACNAAVAAGAVGSNVTAIKAKTDNLPASPAAVGSQMDLVNAPNATAVAAIQNGMATSSAVSTVGTGVSAIQTILAGITSLAQWLGLIAGKQVGNTTARTELRATGAGSGTFDEATDSLEAIKDSGGGNVTVSDITQAALAKFMTVDTGETTAADGSVAKIAQGAAGSGLVDEFSEDALAQLRSSLRGSLVVVRGPFTDPDGDEDTPQELTLVIGDDYLAADGRAIEFDIEGSSLPTTLVGATITLRLKSGKTSEVDVVEIDGEATVPTGATRTIRFEPTALETVELAETKLNTGEYEVNIVDADGHEITPAELRGVLNCVAPLA